MRRLLTYLFLKLCLLQISYCSDQCVKLPQTVYLFEPTHMDKHTYTALHNLIYLLQRKMNVQIVDIKESRLDKVLERLNSYLRENDEAVAIHPYVTDFYQHNYNNISKLDFTLAGNVSTKYDTTELVCRSVMNEIKHIDMNEKKTNKGEPENEIVGNETKVFETCKEFNEERHYVKLVSNNIHKYPELLEYLTNFTTDTPLHDVDWLKFKVIICGSGHNGFYAEKDISVENIPQCNYENTKGAIAVLARKPFELTKKLYTPTLFWNDIYAREDKDMFINSLSLVRSSAKMKFAILEAIKLTGLKRAAIITDDSPSSIDLERELTSLLDRENIIFISKFCVPTQTTCDFEQAFRSLAKADSLLIIVNVDEENAKEFLERASILRKDKVWMVRSWSRQAVQKAVNVIGEVFSVSLGPDLNEPCGYETCHIKLLLSIISQIVVFGNRKPIYENYNCHPRDLFNKIKRKLDYNYDINAFVTWYQNADNAINWVRMSFSPAGLVRIERNAYPTFPSEIKGCTFKSNVYERPCNDIEVMLIMLVVAIFALTLLGIVYFFQIPDRSYSRMTC